MFRRFTVPLFGALAFSLPAVAQQFDAARPDAFLYTAQAILLAFGMAFAGYWADKDRRSLDRQWAGVMLY